MALRLLLIPFQIVFIFQVKSIRLDNLYISETRKLPWKNTHTLATISEAFCKLAIIR